MSLRIVRAMTVASSLLFTLGARADEPKARPLADVLFPEARDFFVSYCVDCHSDAGTHPKKRIALKNQRIERYEDLAGYSSALRGVLDKWHPDGKPMPPRSAKRKPTDDERRAILAWFDRGAPNTPQGR